VTGGTANGTAGGAVGGPVVLPARLIVAVAWLREHYAGPVSVADMAAGVGCGVGELSALTVRYLGCTPAGVLRAARLERARLMLLAAAPARGAVRRVAWSVGYRDLRRFRTEYRERFGELPSRTLREGTTGPIRPGAGGGGNG